MVQKRQNNNFHVFWITITLLKCNAFFSTKKTIIFPNVVVKCECTQAVLWPPCVVLPCVPGCGGEASLWLLCYTGGQAGGILYQLTRIILYLVSSVKFIIIEEEKFEENQSLFTLQAFFQVPAFCEKCPISQIFRIHNFFKNLM